MPVRLAEVGSCGYRSIGAGPGRGPVGRAGTEHASGRSSRITGKRGPSSFFGVQDEPTAIIDDSIIAAVTQRRHPQTVAVYALVVEPTLFVALTVKLNVPTVVGVPEMTPVVEFNVSPAGSVPALIVNVGAGLPLAVSVVDTEVPTLMPGIVPLMTVGAVGHWATLPLKDFVIEPALFVALTVKAYGPAVVGVPEMTPVVGFKESPAGSVPALIVNVGAGLPLAVSGVDIGERTVMAGMVPLMVVGATEAGATVPLKSFRAEPAMFDALMVKAYGPAVVGVPAMTPVVGSKESPAGSEPTMTAKVGVGLPVAVSVVDAGAPTLSAGMNPPMEIGATAAGAMVPVKVFGAEPATFVAVTVKLYGPAVVGVPEMTPVVGFNVSPAGIVPEVTANVGAGLPVAVSGVDTGVFTVRAGMDPLMVGATVAAAMVPLKVFEAVPAMFVAVTVKLYGPAVVGVPAMTPVVGFKESPTGSEPAVTAKVGAGLPVALSVVDAGAPTVRAGMDPLMVGATGAGATVPLKVFEAEPAMFVAVTVNQNGPPVVGVPEMTPVVGFNVNPVGSSPAVTAKVGAGLPLPMSVVDAGAPTVNAGMVPPMVVGATGAAATVPVNRFEAEPALFVAVTVKSYGPAPVGVPAMTPVWLKLSPAGSVPAVTVRVGAGLPVTASVVDIGAFAVRAGMNPPMVGAVRATIAGSAQKASASSVTAKLTDRARPQTYDEAPTVIAAPLNIVPKNLDEAPSVAAPSVTQKMWLAWAPLRRFIVVPAVVLSAASLCMMKKASGSPWASKVTGVVIANAATRWYTPGVTVCPARSSPLRVPVAGNARSVWYAVLASPIAVPVAASFTEWIVDPNTVSAFEVIAARAPTCPGKLLPGSVAAAPARTEKFAADPRSTVVVAAALAGVADVPKSVSPPRTTQALTKTDFIPDLAPETSPCILSVFRVMSLTSIVVQRRCGAG